MDIARSGTSFENAAFALVQAYVLSLLFWKDIFSRLSPTKRLSRDQIPYAQLRSVIGDFVAKQKGTSSSLMIGMYLYIYVMYLFRWTNTAMQWSSFVDIDELYGIGR